MKAHAEKVSFECQSRIGLATSKRVVASAVIVGNATVLCDDVVWCMELRIVWVALKNPFSRSSASCRPLLNVSLWDRQTIALLARLNFTVACLE